MLAKFGSTVFRCNAKMAVPLTHAGAVVFRKRDAQILYLVVSSSDGANWVLPKGHIDAEETPEITALRELAEEAGVLGAIVDRLSIKRSRKADKEIAVEYFLIRELGSTETTEKRICRWEDERSALQLLTFEDARSVLLEGAALLLRLEQDNEARSNS
jgi:8-oxo-dGTP pyrophosphatase MutT (NUDIX family)